MTKVLRMPSSSGQAALCVSGIDVQRVRGDFPILHRKIRGRDLVYLDNAATSQKPKAVIEAISQYYERDNANIHRGVHYLSERATAEFEAARETTQSFLHARRPEEVIFVRGATEAINLVAQTYGRAHVSAGDQVLISAMEHHSNIVPWQLLCNEKGAHLRVAPINDDGELILEEFERLLGPRTKIVAIPHVSNALGTLHSPTSAVAPQGAAILRRESVRRLVGSTTVPDVTRASTRATPGIIGGDIQSATRGKGPRRPQCTRSGSHGVRVQLLKLRSGALFPRFAYKKFA